MSNTLRHTAIFLFTLLATQFASAQSEPEQYSTIFEKLTATEGNELTLETDLTSFIGQKKTNNYLPGVLRTKDGKSYQVEIRPRGRYRRKVSQIPPMKIRFSEDELRAEGLDTLNEIKIALPCFDSDEGNELIVKEYLAYRLFEKVSDAYFRARLINLTIIDTYDTKSKPKKMTAIFVEDEEEVAERFEGLTREVIDQKLVGVKTICEKQVVVNATGNYKTYVAIELSAQDLLAAYNDRLSKDERLRIDYDYEKFKETFDKEMEKMGK